MAHWSCLVERDNLFEKQSRVLMAFLCSVVLSLRILRTIFIMHPTVFLFNLFTVLKLKSFDFMEEIIDQFTLWKRSSPTPSTFWKMQHIAWIHQEISPCKDLNERTEILMVDLTKSLFHLNRFHWLFFKVTVTGLSSSSSHSYFKSMDEF